MKDCCKCYMRRAEYKVFINNEVYNLCKLCTEETERFIKFIETEALVYEDHDSTRTQ